MRTAKVTTNNPDDLLTAKLACPLGCTVETEFDLDRLRSRLYVWGKDYRKDGCRVALSTGEPASMTVDAQLNAIVSLASDTDLMLHRLEGDL
jgi:hypothetical protein